MNLYIRSFLCFITFFIFHTKSFTQCTININSVKVSDCYLSGGISKATVSVEVAWTNPPSGKNINITLSGANGTMPTSRTITPGTITVQYNNNQNTFVNSTQVIVSPQVIAFEVTANGATGVTATAAFAGTTCSTTSTAFSIPAACPLTQCANGQIGGTVFFDFNADGIKQTDETTAGISNVKVKVIDKLGNVDSTLTAEYGRWKLAIPSANYPVRVEFTSLPGYARQGTPFGNDGRTTVQFVSAPNCDIDLGVLNNIDFCNSAPKIFIPAYMFGDPLSSGASSSKDVLYMVDYNASGAKNLSKMTSLAVANEVGSLWGLAYNKYTNRLFAAATIKRHAGMGPKGIGGLYVINPNITSGSKVVASWNVATDFGINAGSIASNSTRGIPASNTTGSIDTEGFTKIGKEGIGDIDISEDGNSLFFTNLFDKKLYKLDLTNYNTNGTKPTSANVTSYSLPTVNCSGGTLRPFATKWYKGLVYVGAVCDAGTSKNKSQLNAYVFKFNPISNGWSTIFDFPLTYPKGFPTADANTATGWFPWTDNFSDFIVTATSGSRKDITYPQPMLTDLEFDVDGSIVIAFGDRGGMQTGYRNKSTPTDDGFQYTGYVGGDILRAYDTGANKYVLENNAKAGPNIGYGAANNQGPGFGEYYNDDWYNDDPTPKLRHAECVVGGMTLRPGSGQIIVGTVDPVDGINWAGGIRHYDNTTGQRIDAYTLYRTTNGDDGTAGKAAGLGDIELMCALPTFIEIGNRAWIDTDNDGIQDPDEQALGGLKVSLYKGTTLIAQTITNVSGEYYFSNRDAVDANLQWFGAGVDTSLIPSTAYTLSFGEGQFLSSVLTLNAQKYTLTVANNNTGLGNNNNDSDATMSGGVAKITIGSSPIEGSVNHTYDIGFFPCLQPNAGMDITVCQPLTTVNLPDAAVGETWSPATGNPSNATINASTGVTAGMANVGTYYFILANSAVCRDTVKVSVLPPPVANAGVDKSICSGATAGIQIGTASIAGNTYAWSPSTSLDNKNLAQPTALPISNTTYIVTVTNTATGCTNTDQVLVSIASLPSGITATTTSATCISGGSTVNSDGKITLSGFAATDKYQYSTGSTFNSAAATPGVITTIPANGIIASNLPNPTGTSQQYAIRITNSAGCFIDKIVTLNKKICSCTSPILSNINDQSICAGSTFTSVSTNVTNGVSVSYQWYNDNGTATGNNNTNAISGQTTATLTILPSVAGTYKYRVEAINTADANCKTSEYVTLIIKTTPTTPTVSNQTICCVSSIDLTDYEPTPVSGVTYQWRLSNGTSVILNPSSVTVSCNTIKDYLIYKIQNGCTSVGDPVSITIRALEGCIPVKISESRRNN